uniref:RanBP2-type domain-containing protein n=1 Tax=Globodera rostochiensis TaxID=31243 RepID=A0A914GRE1_GLORO
MPLRVRLFLLKICQQNRQHHKLISLITAAGQRESPPPPLHFRRFFATKSSPDYEFGTKTEVAAVSGSWRCTNCNRLNWPKHRFCKHCTVGVPTAVQMEQLRRLLWTCPNCSYRNTNDQCWRCKLTKCTMYNGNWVCSNCQWRNIPIHPVCPKCKVGKPTQEQLEHVLEQRWICGRCKHANNYASVCFICKLPKSKKPLEDAEPLSDGSWYCSSCDYLNLPNRLKCRQCKDGVPTEKQRAATLAARWICVECGAYNYKSNSSCHKCDGSRPTDQPISKTDHLGKSLRDGSWYCSNCEYINSPSRLECPNCIVGKPNESQLEQLQRHRWICGNCRHHNYEDDCFKCGVPKASKLPEAAGGEFLPDASWYCSSCDSLNFDTHLVCKQCRAGVPTDEQLFAILEKREQEDKDKEAKGEQQQEKKEAEGEQQQEKKEAEGEQQQEKEAEGEQQQETKKAEGEQQQEKKEAEGEQQQEKKEAEGEQQQEKKEAEGEQQQEEAKAKECSNDSLKRSD